MLVKLAELAKLRLFLQAGAEEFTTEAEEHPDVSAALQFLRMAATIKNVDREIEVLTKKLLNGVAPHGDA